MQARQVCHWWRTRRAQTFCHGHHFALAALVALLAALGPHHRRTSGLPRAPLGADLKADHDVDRVLHDARAAGSHVRALSDPRH